MPHWFISASAVQSPLSDLFSACKYVRPRSLLLPFVSTARTLHGKSLARSIPPTVAAVRCRIWPLLRRGEPDLLINLQLETGKSILVSVEAKYLSLKSGAALEVGRYDWAHPAYSIWPERVREKCKSNKSLAIKSSSNGLYVCRPNGRVHLRAKRSAAGRLDIVLGSLVSNTMA